MYKYQLVDQLKMCTYEIIYVNWFIMNFLTIVYFEQALIYENISYNHLNIIRYYNKDKIKCFLLVKTSSYI